MNDIQAGVYRHYKGPLYLVLGYGHDANVEDLAQWSAEDGEFLTMGERDVVVYIGLQLDEAHSGPRLAVRTVSDFFAMLHQDHEPCPKWTQQMFNPKAPVHRCDCFGPNRLDLLIPRFKYISPTYESQT